MTPEIEPLRRLPYPPPVLERTTILPLSFTPKFHFFVFLHPFISISTPKTHPSEGGNVALGAIDANRSDLLPEIDQSLPMDPAAVCGHPFDLVVNLQLLVSDSCEWLNQEALDDIEGTLSMLVAGWTAVRLRL